MKQSKELLHFTITILVFLLLPFMVFTLLTSKIDVIAHMRSFVVLTGSMQPTIPVGSIVYVQKAKQYEPGDIITFENKGKQTVTHRITNVMNKNNQLFYQTKGDANNAIDEEIISQTQITGQGIFYLPFIGYLVNFLKTPIGFLVLIILPSLVFVTFELWNIKKEIEKSVKEKLTLQIQGV